MTTFFLIWYACGWAAVGQWSKEFGHLTLGDALICLSAGPIAVVVNFFSSFVSGNEIVLWSRDR